MADYPTAIENYTTCSNNFGTRTNPSDIRYYFIHYIGVGTYAGAISWFHTCSPQPSGVSAHYVVRVDGQITQVVKEVNRAYSQGVNEYNQRGIGVEHEAIVTNLLMWESEPMLNSMAALARNVCDRNGIPRVRRAVNGDPGIYGHSDVRATDCPNLTADRWQNIMWRIGGAAGTAGLAVPAPPVLYSVLNTGSGNDVAVSWSQSTATGLIGYRLYYSTSDALTDWKLAADETTLLPATTTVTINPAAFIVPPTGEVYHFEVRAVVNDGGTVVESFGGDVYSRTGNTTGNKVLVVDGFDRWAGSWRAPKHEFTTMYVNALRDRGVSLRVSSAANEKVADGTISLGAYDMVIWYVGDESSADVVLSTAEKNAIKTYLDNGGKLIFTGSEVSYNLSRTNASTYDAVFTNNYLKATYVNDGAASYTPATGISGRGFEGLTMPFGITYPEDSPDAIAAVTGAENLLTYSLSLIHI